MIRGLFVFLFWVKATRFGEDFSDTLLHMKRMHNLVGVDQGDMPLFSDFEDGGEMWTGRGPRERRRRVTFSETFKVAPTVQVGLSMWDIDTATPARMDIKAETVTHEGFDLVFRTWGDTKVARVRANWLAIGPLKHSDDWDLY